MQLFGVMMNDLIILNELINENALVVLEEGCYGKLQVTLVEPKSVGSPGYNINIVGIPKHSIVIKIDEFPAPKPIFKGDKGECKRADFVIITNAYIVFIELKRGTGKNPEIIQQLQGAKCVVDYFRIIATNFWDEPNFLDMTHYKYRFISIKNFALNKKPTYQQDSKEIHDSPRKMLKITAPPSNLQFKQITKTHL